MKSLLHTLVALLVLAPALRAEPKEYSGSLAGIKVTAVLNWVDEKSVVGVITSGDGVINVTLSGQNTRGGEIKAALTEGVEPRGTVRLVKSTTAASIIWSGKVTGTSGEDAGVLELQRPR